MEQGDTLVFIVIWTEHELDCVLLFFAFVGDWVINSCNGCSIVACIVIVVVIIIVVICSGIIVGVSLFFGHWRVMDRTGGFRHGRRGSLTNDKGTFRLLSGKN